MKRVLGICSVVFPAAAVVLLFCGGPVASAAYFPLAQNEDSDQPDESAKLAERIEMLIRQLDADAFAEREKAEKALIEIGAPAREALEKAAESDSAEVQFRAKRALEKVRLLANNLQLVEKVSHEDLRYAVSTAVSRDGNFLYAAGWQANAVTVFNRDAATGRLTHLQTVSDPQSMQGAVCLRLSPDGNYAAAAAFRAKTVLLFKRDVRSGRLTILDTVQGTVGNAAQLQWPIELTFSPDSKFLYAVDPRGSGRAAAGATGVLFCFRISEAGKLELVEALTGKDNCFTGSRTLVVHPDGRTVYVPSSTRGMLTVLSRQPQTGRLTIQQTFRDGENGVEGLSGAHGVDCSGDGKFLYVCSGRFEGDQAVSVFKIASDGSLSLVQQLFNDREGLSNCRGANEILVSRDGKHVYVAATVSGYVIDFRRDGNTGKLHGAEMVRLAAGEGEGELGPAGLGLSPDDRHLYVAVEGSGEIAVFRRSGIQENDSPASGNGKRE